MLFRKYKTKKAAKSKLFIFFVSEIIQQQEFLQLQQHQQLVTATASTATTTVVSAITAQELPALQMINS
jgi:hypothetical protein